MQKNKNADVLSTKKAHEKKVLQDVLWLCGKKGGARGRNAKRLTATIVMYERPDIIIEIADNKLIGLEHFRVDHHINKDKKAQSKTAKLESELESGRNEANKIRNTEEQLNFMAQTIGDIVSESLKNFSKSCLEDLVVSFEKRITDNNYGHAKNLKQYRSNLIDHSGEAMKIEIGYLVEVYSDFKGLFFNESHKTRRLDSGECPLFVEIYDLLKEASSEVDWILLGFYSPFSKIIKDAVIINCRNGYFETSCIQQGFRRTEYLALSKTEPFLEFSVLGECSINFKGEETEFTFHNEMKGIEAQRLHERVIENTSKALSLLQNNTPFVADIATQLCLESIQVVSKRHRTPFTKKIVKKILQEVPEEQLKINRENFERRYGLNEDLNN